MYGIHAHVLTKHKSLQYVFTEKDLNLHKRRSLEFLKDYDISVHYNPCYVNVVTGSLRTFSVGGLPMLRKKGRN